MTATKKRAREMAKAKEERRRAREAAMIAKRKRRRKIVASVSVVAIVAVLVGGFVLQRTLSDSGEATSDSDSAPEQATGAAAAITQGEQVVASCQPPGELQQTPLTFDKAGDSGLGTAATATFTFATNCGDIVVSADAKAAPQTVNAMAFLANQKYFDQTLCHRVTTDGLFVLQCGDPTATGTGGPGFTLPDENLPQQTTNNYPAGTIAMANSGPGTSGSQFFIVYKDTTLPANYTIWGKVTAGLDIVNEIAAAGTTDGGTDGAPKQAAMIQKATAQPE